MGEIKFETGAINKAADAIDKCNDMVKGEFADLSREVLKLSNSWKSSVADDALGKFKEIETRFEAERYAAMGIQSAYLRKLVTVDYEAVESNNTQNAKNCI